MWIVYVGITTVAYAISNGFYNSSVGSAIVTLVVISSIGGIIHAVYPYTHPGIIRATVKKEIDREYTEHRNCFFSKNNLNIITYCIVFLFFIL